MYRTCCCSCLLVLTLTSGWGLTQEKPPAAKAAQNDPTQMLFRRQAVRRFLFNNNLPLTRLDPKHIVALDLMHPIAAMAGAGCDYSVREGVLLVSNPRKETTDSVVMVGAVNPYATYEVEVQQVVSGAAPAEVGVDLSSADFSRRLMVLARHPATNDALVLRLEKDGKPALERVILNTAALVPPYTLRVQLAGCGLAVFTAKDGVTTYRGHLDFLEHLDLRERRVARDFKFNVVTRLAAGGQISLRRAESYLGAGAGQADIRLITHKDGAPFVEDNRLWFTFSARGLPIEQSSQGVLSLDPSTFDPRFEGTIVYDRGDGLLRNDYGSHVFYDDDAQEWRAFVCNFSAGKDGRGPTGLSSARSAHDPRRGFSVMSSQVFENIPDSHEDPCCVFDAEAKKWRLVTTRLKDFRALLYEADNWNGPYKLLAGPVTHDSTGTLIQKLGNRRYVFAGSNENAVFIYSYPELKQLGQLRMDFAPWNQSIRNARVWPNIFPLPAGFPARYMALMMDRANFPGVKGANWSYGALYLFAADADELGAPEYEYAPVKK